MPRSSLAGTLVVGTMMLPVAPRKDLFPIAPGRLKGGNSGPEGDSQGHQPQQKTWMPTTAPRAALPHQPGQGEGAMEQRDPLQRHAMEGW